MKTCTQCGRDRPEYCFVDDVCTSCVRANKRGELVETMALEAAIMTWDRVRDRRNEMLVATDWTQLPDVPEATRQSWQAYRQALRNVTSVKTPELAMAALEAIRS